MNTQSKTTTNVPDESFDYDVFLSYRRVDGRALANWLRGRLQSYRLPPKRLWTSTGLQLGQFAGSKGALSQEALGGDFGGAGLAFSPDSAKIAIAQSGGTVALYRIQTLGEFIQTGCAWLKPYLDSHPEVPNPCRQSKR